MVIFSAVKLKELFKKERDYAWQKPNSCPCCNSFRLWGHGQELNTGNIRYVPASDNNAKLVVMLEMRDESELLGGITAIEAVPGVVSATLVFHQVEDMEATS